MNLGFTDRIIRLIAGITLLAIDFVASGDWELALLGWGAWGVMTSAFGWCPFYRIGGINTCPIDYQPQKE